MRRSSAGLVFGFAVAGCLATPVGDLRASGTIVLEGGPFVVGGPCGGSGPTELVAEGQPIEIGATDVQGPVATGIIGPGVASTPDTCELTFIVDGIPRGFEQYRVEVGSPQVGVLGSVNHLDERTVIQPITILVQSPSR